MNLNGKSHPADAHSIAAEQAVLGDALQDGTQLDCVDLREDEFSRPDHRLIWRALRAMRANGDAIDTVTVSQYLQLGNELDSAGGMPYIGRLAREALCPDHIQTHAEIVRAHARNRALADIGVTLLNPDLPASDKDRLLRLHAEPSVSQEEQPDANAWPTLSEHALQGVVGRIVRAACEDSEADPAAVLISVLAWFGTSFGNGPHRMVGDTKHYTRLFAVKVGASSRARKGTSEDPPKRVFQEAERLGTPRGPLKVSPGPLSSGEGIVRAVRDESDVKDDEGRPLDAGVPDKRLLVTDGEMAAGLKAVQREGNTLSAIMRTLWDSGDVEPLTKSNRIKTTGAHISVIGHITREELSKLLCTTELFNGFANRFLWCCVRRSKAVPSPRGMSAETVTALAREVRDILEHAHQRSEVKWSQLAETQWARMYESITEDKLGSFGAVTSRAEAQIQRLALIYALIDKAECIDLAHFMAAVAVWSYAKDSARLLFEGAGADPNRAKVVEFLAERPLTQSEINVRFSGHLKGHRLKALLEDLQASGTIRAQKESTTGRPVTRWFLHTPPAKKAEEAEEGVSTDPYSASYSYSAGGKS